MNKGIKIILFFFSFIPLNETVLNRICDGNGDFPSDELLSSLSLNAPDLLLTTSASQSVWLFENYVYSLSCQKLAEKIICMLSLNFHPAHDRLYVA